MYSIQNWLDSTFFLSTAYYYKYYIYYLHLIILVVVIMVVIFFVYWFFAKNKKNFAIFCQKTKKKAKKKFHTYISTNNATNSLFMNIIEYTLNRNYNQLFIGKVFICKISFFEAEIINWLITQFWSYLGDKIGCYIFVNIMDSKWSKQNYK